jgi:hypothetical protein
MFTVVLSNRIFYFIFESQRDAYVWYRGLQSLSNMSSASKVQSLPLVVSNRLRIGNNEMINDNNNNNNTLQFIKNIRCNFDEILNEVNNLYHFASQACILDSTEHLALLSQSIKLKNLTLDIEKILNKKENSTTIDDITNLHELWLSLHSDLCVVALKSDHMRRDMELSRLPTVTFEERSK